jgi:hypothetical protein
MRSSRRTALITYCAAAAAMLLAAGAGASVVIPNSNRPFAPAFATPRAVTTACASFSRVKSFQGTVHMGFSEIATGAIPGEGTTGTAEAELYRSASHLNVSLTRKVDLGHGQVAFSGRMRGGEVDIDDSFHTNTGDTDSAGREAYNGPAQPEGAGAALYVNTQTCTYQLVATVEVPTTFFGSDEVQPEDAVASASAFSPRRHVPASLKLSGGVKPDAYFTCPGNPLESGDDCYQLGGGWAADFASLKACETTEPVNCNPDEEVLGTAGFVWSLTPAYKHS